MPLWTRNVVVAAVGNFSTAYNLVVINIVHVIVENQYCGGALCDELVETASTACLVGAVLGQLTFGAVGDSIGRAPALRVCMAFSVVGALLSACAVPVVREQPPTIFLFLAAARMLLGVGVGGVYPLSATIAAESAAAASRGTVASLVFSMQGVANLAVPLVALALLGACGEPRLGSYATDTGWAWRRTWR